VIADPLKPIRPTFDEVLSTPKVGAATSVAPAARAEVMAAVLPR
jgi:hypothetical protein